MAALEVGVVRLMANHTTALLEGLVGLIRGPAYDPAAHAVHAPPFGPANPGLQRQLAGTLLPLGDCEFPGHSSQVENAVAPRKLE